MKKQLKSFNLQEFERIMDKFGAVPRIFNNEAQFQFELAWKIKEKFDCEVKLQELSCISEGKKDYTDILLEKDGFRIALELMYRIAKYEDESQNIYLETHGEAIFGAYDFMRGVHKIQVLTGLESSSKYKVKKPCNRGYVIILTNDINYWHPSVAKNTKDGPRLKDTINRDFHIGCMHNCDGFLCKNRHQWYTADGEIGFPKILLNSPSRKSAIDLQRNYFYQWQTYHTIETADTYIDFRYMAVEVDPNSKKKYNQSNLVSMRQVIAMELAMRILRKYEYLWFTCLVLACSAIFKSEKYITKEMQDLDIDALAEQVFADIDAGVIKE